MRWIAVNGLGVRWVYVAVAAGRMRDVGPRPARLGESRTPAEAGVMAHLYTERTRRSSFTQRELRVLWRLAVYRDERACAGYVAQADGSVRIIPLDRRPARRAPHQRPPRRTGGQRPPQGFLP